jgi:hypothetical protein
VRASVENDIGEKSWDIIKTKGWIAWKCKELNGEVIIIVRSGLVQVSEKYVRYTINELETLCDQDNFKLIHEAKKLGAVIE